MMEDNNDNNNRKRRLAYHLVPKSILLLNILVICKVITDWDLVQSFELNNDGQ